MTTHLDDINGYYRTTLTSHLSHSKRLPDFQRSEGFNSGHGFGDFINIKELDEDSYVKEETLMLRCELKL